MSETSDEQNLAISIRQPWAQLIILGRKSVEIREWTTSYRGPVWIHASKTVDTHAEERFQLGPTFKGGIIGRANLVDVVPFNPKRWAAWRDLHLDLGQMPFRAMGFVFEDAVALDIPLAVSGKLKLFPLDDDIVGRLPPAVS